MQSKTTFNPVTDRRKRRAAKEAQREAQKLHQVFSAKSMAMDVQHIVSELAPLRSAGVAPVGPMQILLPAVCATSQMSAYERWAHKPYTDTAKSGWERYGLVAVQEAFRLGAGRTQHTLQPLTHEQWPTPVIIEQARKPVAMSIRDEGI